MDRIPLHELDPDDPLYCEKVNAALETLSQDRVGLNELKAYLDAWPGDTHAWSFLFTNYEYILSHKELQGFKDKASTILGVREAARLRCFSTSFCWVLEGHDNDERSIEDRVVEHLYNYSGLTDLMVYWTWCEEYYPALLNRVDAWRYLILAFGHYFPSRELTQIIDAAKTRFGKLLVDRWLTAANVEEGGGSL